MKRKKAAWLTTQRKRFYQKDDFQRKIKKLTVEQRKALESLKGFTRIEPDDYWEEQYNLLKKEMNEKRRMPRDGEPMYGFSQRQRSLFVNGDLKEERVKLLNSTEYWSFSLLNDKRNEMIQKLEDWYISHKEMPKQNRDNSDEYSLQRFQARLKKKNFTPEQIEKLEKLPNTKWIKVEKIQNKVFTETDIENLKISDITQILTQRGVIFGSRIKREEAVKLIKDSNLKTDDEIEKDVKQIKLNKLAVKDLRALLDDNSISYTDRNTKKELLDVVIKSNIDFND